MHSLKNYIKTSRKNEQIRLKMYHALKQNNTAKSPMKSNIINANRYMKYLQECVT